jgi:SOS-response transcriptional repressor LexA
MHITQKKILSLAGERDISEMSLRMIGRLVGVHESPEQVKHHLLQLQKKGFIDTSRRPLEKDTFEHQETHLIKIPIYGSVNCGPATLVADDNLEGYLNVSPSILKKLTGIFALRAEGNSMNEASVIGMNIEPGDYVIVDSTNKSPKDNQYVVSIIDGCANVKKYSRDLLQQAVILKSETSEESEPIYIHMDDLEDYAICGVVTQIIKKP